jgi:hypothetical protein
MSVAAGESAAFRGFPGRRLIAAFAVLAMLACSSVQALMVKTGADAGPQKLFVTILDGENALNNIRQRDAREPVVQVTDENHKPVAGVALHFLIHDEARGANASFNGASSFATTTGPDGMAKTTGLQVGHTPGTYTITVTATLIVTQGSKSTSLTLESSTVGHP